MRDNRLKTKLGSWEIDNPIIPASGTFGYGYEHTNYYDINILGTFSTKGATLEPRFGNKTPRIAECNGCMINAIGLQNPGIDHVINHEFANIKKVYHKKIIANVYANSLEDFLTCCKKLEHEEIVGIIELNISCPNVKKGEKNFSINPSDLEWLITNLKKEIKKPIYVKLAPMVSDIVTMAKAVKNGNGDGVVVSNTLNGMKIDIKTKKPLLANKFGGVSGPGVKPIIMRQVYLIHQALKDFPIIASGGAMNAEDVIEFMLAGASAVEIGTANLINPYACKEIIEDLQKLMDKLGIKQISDIIGGAHD